MKFTFWGTRGSISVSEKYVTKYGGNTCCLELELPGDKVLIVDAGTGIRALGDKIAKEKKKNIYLLITHLHLDHIRGFPFFTPVFDPTCNLYLDGHGYCLRGIQSVFSNNNFPGIFPVPFSALKANISYLNKIIKEPLQIEGITIDCMPVHHPQGCFSFRFRKDSKTVVFMTDNELSFDKNSAGYIDKFVNFTKNANVLIHDAQYTPEEHHKYLNYGHSNYATVIKLAEKANVKKIFLFHHDPCRTDNGLDEILNQCQNICKNNNNNLEIDLAQEKKSFIF